MGKTNGNGGVLIRDVRILKQKEAEIYAFSLPARMALQLCRVDRFGEATDGVNRKLDEQHALQIAEYMLTDNAVMMEPLLGDLKGSWNYNREERTLDPGEDGYISIDDGQHRLAALRLLNDQENQRWTFAVQATWDAPYEQRLRIFRQQTFRKRIDPKLDLAQRHQLGDWRHPSDAEAYNIAMMLNSSPRSPLQGKIQMGESVRTEYKRQHQPSMISVTGLMTTLRTLIGQSSPLNSLSPERRAEVILLMLSQSREVWPRAWENEDRYMLVSGRGINALLQLITRSPEFRASVGHSFTADSIRRGLEAASSFDWTQAKHRHASTREIVDRINQSMIRNRNRQARSN